MALPSISTPEFVTKIPSTGQEVRYRPFLVKEEKILLMAMEGEDANEIQRAVLNILSSCILSDGVDVNKLAVFDIEYLFLNLRGKSVGEVINLKVGHSDSECKHKTDYSMNIEEVQVEGEISEGKIELTETVGLKMRYPSVQDVVAEDTTTTDGMFRMFARCVEYIYDENEVYREFTIEEMVEWIEKLDQSSFQKISKFYETLPRLSHKVQWTCSECGKKDEVVLEGLASFFT